MSDDEEFLDPETVYDAVAVGDAIALRTRGGRVGITFDLMNNAISGEILHLEDPATVRPEEDNDPAILPGVPFVTIGVDRRWQIRDGQVADTTPEYDTFEDRESIDWYDLHIDSAVHLDSRRVRSWLNIDSEGWAQLLCPMPMIDRSSDEPLNRAAADLLFRPFRGGQVIALEAGPIVDLDTVLRGTGVRTEP